MRDNKTNLLRYFIISNEFTFPSAYFKPFKVCSTETQVQLCFNTRLVSYYTYVMSGIIVYDIQNH